jgi:hypothetical protein
MLDAPLRARYWAVEVGSVGRVGWHALSLELSKSGKEVAHVPWNILITARDSQLSECTSEVL